MEELASSHVTRPNLWLDKYDMLPDEFSPFECNSMLDHTGACGSCPSSTTTMKMGIERALKEKFGEAVKDIRQVSDEPQNAVATVEAVNGHLGVLRPAIKNYGGTVEVLSIDGGDCHVSMWGPTQSGQENQSSNQGEVPRHCECSIYQLVNPDGFQHPGP